MSSYTELSNIILEVKVWNFHSVSLQIIQYSYITKNVALATWLILMPKSDYLEGEDEWE